MALKLTRETAIGLTATDAYLRVEGVTLPTKNTMEFRLRSYAGVVHPAFGPPYPAFLDEGFDCAYDLNGSNPIAQAYAHLKTLPDFADATDV